MADGSKAQQNSSWIVHQQSFEEDRLLHYEGLFTLGSGLLHVRGSFEEQLPGEQQDRRYLRLPANVTSEKHARAISHRGTYLPPVRAVHPLLNSVVVNLPSPLGIEIHAGGRLLHAQSDRVITQSRSLDMRTASLVRETEWDQGAGTLYARYERFVSRVRPNLICQRVILHARTTTQHVQVRSAVTTAVTTNGYNHLDALVCETTDTLVSIRADVSGSAVWVGSTLRDGSGLQPASLENSRTDTEVGQQVELELPADVPIALVKYSWVASSRSPGGREFQAAGQAELERAAEIGYGALREEHEAAWRELWADSDIVMTGSADSQRAIRFSVFSLLRSHRAGLTGFGICPKGHAGEAYFGRYFWDTEIYLLPFFIHSDPEHARDLLRYRVQSLSGARANARRYGYPGARYAWEADGDGYEHCPNWQYADHEIHVTADVAFGIAHYVSATDDKRFLFEEALPAILEGARYWMARIDHTADGSPVLLGVMGPDEYKPLSRDNAFTNRLVKFHLLYAARSARECAERFPELWGRHVVSLRFGEEELSGFERTAGGLSVPFDDERQIIAQSADFKDHIDVDVAEMRDKAGGSIGTGAVASQVSQERLYRIKALKQADVVALLSLFPEETDRHTADRTYEYYESITTHDSSLSASTHATVAAQLGRVDEAFRFFERSLVVDVDPTDGDAGQGVHIANCGGNWQTVVYGFLGLRPAFASGEVKLDPHVPSEIEAIECSIYWQGSQISITIDHAVVTVERRSGPAIPVEVRGERRVVQTKEKWRYATESV